MAGLLCDVARIASYRQASVALRGWMTNGRGFDSAYSNSSDDIMSKLKLLGKIQATQKLCVHNLSLQPVGWSTSIQRTFIQPDSKENTLAFASAVISNAFLILDAKVVSVEPSDKFLCREIIADLLQCQCGLKNLTYTYSLFPHFVSQIDTLITTKVQVPLSKYKDKYPELFPDDFDVTPSYIINIPESATTSVQTLSSEDREFLQKSPEKKPSGARILHKKDAQQ